LTPLDATIKRIVIKRTNLEVRFLAASMMRRVI